LIQEVVVTDTNRCRRRSFVPVVVLAGLCFGVAETPAQTSPLPVVMGGPLSGQVIDAASDLPIPDAAVTIEPYPTGVLPANSSAEGVFLRSTRTALTNRDGEYHFAALSAGAYRLHIQRLGYRSASVDVEIRGSADPRLSVGLTVEPVVLRPVRVSGRRAAASIGSYGRMSDRAVDESRIAAERLRQRQHLATDVRAITHADLIEGVTLAETDLFRALQRLPGVSAGDEYMAELWVRGAPWDQTRVYFDGLPLFNPVHALGLFSGVNPDAIGGAFLHVGVQPVSSGGGAAGVLDLRSRRGAGDGDLRGMGELSLASGRLALDGGAADGRRTWMIAARRSHVDVLTGIAERILGPETTYQFPYSFVDITGRFDARIGTESALEMSGLFQRNAFGNDNFDVLNGAGADVRNNAARATLHAPLGALRTQHTVGLSGFVSGVPKRNGQPNPDLPSRLPAQERSGNRINYITLEGTIEDRVSSPSSPITWSAGYQIVRQQRSYDGPRPTSFVPLAPEEYRINQHDGMLRGSVWAEGLWHASDALAIEPGLRLETSARVRNGGYLRWSPRLVARYRIGSALSLSAAAGRSYQYIQAVSTTGATAHPGFSTEYLWVLAGDSVPAIRADVATLGAETWLSHGWLGAVNVYARHSTGVAIPDPAPGPNLDRPLFVASSNRARGVEMSARKLTGRWTGSASYTYGVSRLKTNGLHFPAPADQRHVFDATAMMQLTPSWTAGAAYTAASGAPYTRSFAGEAVCDDAGSPCTWVEQPWTGEPNARRLDPFRSLDLFVDWSREYRTWDLHVYLQLRNALNRNNPGRYLGYGGIYCVNNCGPLRTGTPFGPGGEILPADPDTLPVPGPRDEFLGGLPFLPLIGARISF
jgi:hypothetical protein